MSIQNDSIGFDAVADSGAQSDLWSLEKFLRAGYSKEDLYPVVMSLNAANKSPIKISGAFFATIAGRSPTGKKITCRSMIYVSPDVKRFYLCYDTMLALGILNRDFPKVGAFSHSQPDEEIGNTLKSRASDTESGFRMICGATKEMLGTAFTANP